MPRVPPTSGATWHLWQRSPAEADGEWSPMCSGRQAATQEQRFVPWSHPHHPSAGRVLAALAQGPASPAGSQGLETKPHSGGHSCMYKEILPSSLIVPNPICNLIIKNLLNSRAVNAAPARRFQQHCRAAFPGSKSHPEILSSFH